MSLAWKALTVRPFRRRFLETSFESTVLALLAIAAIVEDFESMRTERQALFLSSLALSLLSMSCAHALPPSLLLSLPAPAFASDTR